MTSEAKKQTGTNEDNELIIEDLCAHYKKAYDSALEVAKKAYSKQPEEQASAAARDALEKLSVLKNRAPLVLLDAAYDAASDHLRKNPTYEHCIKARNMVEAARKRCTSPKYTGVDAFIAVYKAAEEAELEDKKWFHGSSLFTVFRSGIQGWYEGNSTVGRLAAEVQKLKAAEAAARAELQKVKEAKGGDGALQEELAKARKQLADNEVEHKALERSIRELKAAALSKDDDRASVTHSIAASEASTVAGKATHIKEDAKIVGSDGKTPPSSKPAFYLDKIVKRLNTRIKELNVELSRAKKKEERQAVQMAIEETTNDVQSISAAYDQLRVYIDANDGRVHLPNVSHPRHHIVKQQLSLLAEVLDGVVRVEALNHHQKKKSTSGYIAKYEQSIAYCVGNIFKTSGSLFVEADPSKVDEYAGYWKHAPEVSGLISKESEDAKGATDENGAIRSLPASRRNSADVDPLASLESKRERTGSTAGMSLGFMGHSRQASGSGRAQLAGGVAPDDTASESGKSATSGSFKSDHVFAAPAPRQPKQATAVPAGSTTVSGRADDEVSESGSTISAR